ncbi:hypothetical protein MSP8886_00079 [Marinomonas spartinae]|uniref:Uncharacterized protein n=1 Tax=Marinomonas spartinae TaxID=1792290 RepID=A0A1A8SZX0_9GAMM|nr:hypothetical protein [Marinomonas spartinae]SBS24778.1 hypothetical protein MSP8886_00079 [Marinomonas spartinae]
MKLSIISGSHRSKSYSLKAATYLQRLSRLVFRHCNSLLLSDKAVSDEQFDRRAKYAMKSLKAYAKALGTVRATLQKDMQKFPFGM